MAPITIRLATEADVDRILEIVNAVPGVEAVALLGSDDLALRYDDGLFRLDPITSGFRTTVLAQDGDRIVGVLRYQFGEDAQHHSRVDVLRLLLKLLGPIRLARRLPGIYSRTKVDVPIPADSLHIATLQVEPAARGQHVGRQLVEWAEAEAVRLGAGRMSIVTAPTNEGALKFYERLGFHATKTVTDPSYEKHTGIPGRVYIEKVLQTRTP
jgi:ribosomal protein S18 acetylase RimI-like enzyme